MDRGEREESIEKTVKKAVGPWLAPFGILDEFTRQAEGEKSGNGTRAHSSQVAEAAREGAMANGVGRVPVKAEVTIGNGEVGGYGEFFSCPQTEESAIVTNAQVQSGMVRFVKTSANPGQQSQFTLPAGARIVGHSGEHFLRIGHDAGSLAGRTGAEAAEVLPGVEFSGKNVSGTRSTGFIKEEMKFIS
jgi:hypothetical protein